MAEYTPEAKKMIDDHNRRVTRQIIQRNGAVMGLIDRIVEVLPTYRYHEHDGDWVIRRHHDKGYEGIGSANGEVEAKLICNRLNNTVSTEQAYNAIEQAIRDDDDYAWTWHCNISIQLQDEGGSHEQANRAAARFMQTAFGVDVTTFDQWEAFDWASVPST